MHKYNLYLPCQKLANTTLFAVLLRRTKLFMQPNKKMNFSSTPSDLCSVTKKGVTYCTDTGKVIDCLFCRIQNRTERGTIVYEDSEYVAFKTIMPASNLHLLITPRTHIKNTKSLSGQEGANLVRSLVRIGEIALGPEFATDALYCFHLAPWNSIDHLHLHAIASPNRMNLKGAMKYNTKTFWCSSAMDLASELEKQV